MSVLKYYYISVISVCMVETENSPAVLSADEYVSNSETASQHLTTNVMLIRK